MTDTENKNLPARLEDVADVMLKETASSNPLLRFKKGEYFIGEDEVEVGHRYIAYPFDTMCGIVRWQDDAVVEQRLGRIRDGFRLERDDLPADEDWKEQRVLPLEDAETGEFVAFVSGSFGGKKAINNLINTTARAVKEGRGDATPLIQLSVGSFNSKEYGKIACPAFEIVKAVVEQRLGRIRDGFRLERDDLPADEDWKEQRVLPLEDAETGEFVAFVSGSFGGKKAINNLINTTARAVKEGRGDATPLIQLSVGSFNSKEYGKIACPAFEIVKQPPQQVKTIKEEMSDEISF